LFVIFLPPRDELESHIYRDINDDVLIIYE
jgi:hypothetical protein